MKRFADALRSALAEMNWTPAMFSRENDIVSASALSRYLSGIELPKPSTLGQIGERFPDQLREELVSAYLLDQIPQWGKTLVAVKVIREEGELPPLRKADKPQPGSLLERNLATLGRYAISDPNLSIVIDYLASSLEGRAPVSDDSGENLTVFTVEEQARIAAAKKHLGTSAQSKRAEKSKGVRYTSKRTER